MLVAQGKDGEAVSFFQRVVLAHQKWKPILARAYLLGAKAFIELNRPQQLPERKNSDREAAKLMLLEMTKRDDLKAIEDAKPILREAEQLLAGLSCSLP